MKEYITLIRDCGCESACQHKIVSITHDIMLHKDELNDFLKEFDEHWLIFIEGDFFCSQ